LCGKYKANEIQRNYLWKMWCRGNEI
jgi:hypothetical protein